MNDKLQNVLADLAAKFGTSVEHLWKVMIYQAKISACVDIIQYSILVIVGIVLFRIHRKLSRVINGEGGRYRDTGYDQGDAPAAIMIIVSSIWLIIVIIAFCSIGNTISALFNPEYWALKQILDK